MFCNLIIGIDDTDDIGTKGTGAIASELCQIIEENGFGSCGEITRHQLLIHPDIAYTSHNSAMVFTAKVKKESLIHLKKLLCEHLKKESAPLSDPGICILDVDDSALANRSIVSFGYVAKNKVLTKAEAYEFAQRNNIFLQEHGGEGIGIIGALAGVLLRLDGNDGELKGGLKNFLPQSTTTAKQIRKHKKISDVLDAISEKPIEDEQEIYVPWKVKPVLHKGEFIVFAQKDETGKYCVFQKQEMRDFVEKKCSISPCSSYCPDVSEEMTGFGDSCLNCAYRRFTQKGFTCVLKGQNS